jgi:FkbM family methyltransferase
MSQVIESLFGQLHEFLREEAALPFLAGSGPVYIYGAGNVGKDVFRLLREKGIEVAALLDRRAQPGASWQGVPILVPDDPGISPSARKAGHVIIGIFNYQAEIPPIQHLLASLGYGRVTTFLDLHHHFVAELGNRYWLTKLDFYPGQKERIAAGYDLFSDEASRELFATVLRFRFTRDYSVLPTPSLADPYFPAGLPSWPGPLRFIDCGAFDGDTLRQLRERKLAVEAVAAFEPDPGNFRKLADFTPGTISEADATTVLFPCGVSEKTKQVRFSTGQGTSSAVSETGDGVIQCVALDDALPSFRPNLIKMDIEGAEYDALLGARRMIERHRPGLAICLYHRPDHLWTIPLLVASWLPGGRHYLRAHAHNTFELVYYWMP